MRLKCSRCGAFAGNFQQFANQDTGWGICRDCVDHALTKGTSPADIRGLYGIEGVHYQSAAPSPTPGPWHYVYGAVWSTPNGPEDGGVCVATRASAAPIEPSVKYRNMRLCAAAPDLLDAIEEAIETMRDAGINPSARMYAAIMKAREPSDTHPYTVFCREASGEGTTWIGTVYANTPDEAADIGRRQCSEDWEFHDYDNVAVIGVARGDVHIEQWDDKLCQ